MAVGDALGTTLEFKPPGSFNPIDDMVGGGPFGLKPGQWTDDTSMAACLAESLVECGGFDAADQMRRYCRWWREGYWSSNGRFFDIGVTTRTALASFERTGNPFAGPTHRLSAGNGSLMRLAPVATWFQQSWAEADRAAAESSRTTHGAIGAVDACRLFAGLLVGALHGVPKEELLSPGWAPVPRWWDDNPLDPGIDAIAKGAWRDRKSYPATGHVVRTLDAALWAFAATEDFRTGSLKAVNLGNDADTTGAVFGQLAGAYYGSAGIPPEWLRKLARRSELQALAARLALGSGRQQLHSHLPHDRP